MFADLDGFTPLAERFSQLPANEGAEELTGLINQFMAILIRTSRTYGGDLLKFGGDAGLLYFEGPGHALRAVTAAMAVQRMMREQLSYVETSLGQFALRAAIGIGSGRMIGLGVGDGEGRELLTLGPPLRAMGHAQNIAPPAEVVIHCSTAEACGDGVECVAVESDYYRVVAVPGMVQGGPTGGVPMLPAPDGPDPVKWYLSRLDALSSYLSPDLLELLTSELTVDADVVSSDRRLVTVIMISLASMDDLMVHWGDVDGLLRAATIPSETFICIRDAIHRYGGVLDKIAIGPAGPYLMVLFGAPKAHEDDPLRAVLAALELEELFGRNLRIGINTGYVFAGDVGTEERREYTVMGDEVNLAARLMSSCAAGSIWLGPNTGRHPAVHRRVVVELVAPTHFKGKSQPIRPYVVQSLRQSFATGSGDTTALVGRESELSHLWSQLERSSSRGPRFVLLHGEAGVGKSVLSYAIVDNAMDQGVAVHIGAAPSYGDYLPFAGWDRVLLSLLGLDEVRRERQQETLVMQLAQYGVALWAALVAPIVGLSVPASVEVLSLPPVMRDVQRQSALLTILTRAARDRPRLLVFDNAQWMSTASIELLDAVIDALPNVPLDVCVIARDHTAVAEHWQGRSRVSDFQLGPLSATAMHKLVAVLLDDVPVPASVTEWIVERSAGLPIFATEAVRTLVESGLLQRQDGGWVLAGTPADFQLPDMIYALIQSRIDQLAPPNRHLLRAAAAVGNEMTLPILTAAYGEETEAGVSRMLPLLVPFGLQSRGTSGQLLFFRQPLVREVAYRGLLSRVQRQIHHRLARYLDANREQAAPNWLTLLAHHTFEGHIWARAVEANLTLGRQAVQTYLAEQARHALTRVLEAADSGELPVPDARFEAHYLLSETLTSLGLYDDALAHLGAARQIFERGASREVGGEDLRSVARVAGLDCREATVLEGQGRYREALEIVERGLAIPGVAQMVEGARLSLVGADLQRRLRKYGQARVWAGRALAMCQQSSDAEAQQVCSRAMYMVALLSSLERLQDSGGSSS